MKNSVFFGLLFVGISSFSQKVFISEFHYDGPGTDTFEFVEVTAPSGNNLSCYKLFYVNGTTGAPAVYKTINLKDSLTKGLGYGTLNINDGSTNQIQNGSNDGFLLYDVCLGRVVQYISYEGKISGLAPYTDSSSVDVGVSETSASDSSSIQLEGTLNDMTWTKGISSPGILNPSLLFGTNDKFDLWGNFTLNSNNCEDYITGPEISVTLFSKGPDQVLGTADDDFFSVHADPKGVFSFRNIDSGSYFIKLNLPAGYEQIGSDSTVDVVLNKNLSLPAMCIGQVITDMSDIAWAEAINVSNQGNKLSVTSEKEIKEVVVSNVVGHMETHNSKDFHTLLRGILSLSIVTKEGVYFRRIFVE